MGEARRRQYNRQQLLAAHPNCIYCGAPATTTDHCPPRCCFRHRYWPEGYEFPACEKCNADARLDEIVIGVLARTRLKDDRPGTVDGDEMLKLLEGLKNNRPEIVAEMTDITAVGQKRSFRRMFGSDGDRLRHMGWGAANIGPKLRATISRFSVKLAQALYYYHIGRIFDGQIIVQHNSALLDASDFFQKILEIMPAFAETVRSRKSLTDQFSYRYNASAEHGAFVALVEFNPQMLITIMAMSTELKTELDAQGMVDATAMIPENRTIVNIPPVM